jgi:hypothetical protein
VLCVTVYHRCGFHNVIYYVHSVNHIYNTYLISRIISVTKNTYHCVLMVHSVLMDGHYTELLCIQYHA